jgi:hypothetical protein
MLTTCVDAEFNEADHPRAANGQFGSGGGGSSSEIKTGTYGNKSREPVSVTVSKNGDFAIVKTENREIKLFLEKFGEWQGSKVGFKIDLAKDSDKLQKVIDRERSKDAEKEKQENEQKLQEDLAKEERLNQEKVKSQKEEKEKQEKAIAQAEKTKESSGKVNELVSMHGEDRVREDLSDIFSGNKVAVEKVISGEKALTEKEMATLISYLPKNVKSDSESESLNELDVARKIMSGELPSPQQFGNMWLFDIRITGTGTAYRTRGDEFVYRPPEHYMTENFLARCNGLSVIWQHPDQGTLTSDEFADRAIGSVFLPYLKHDEKEVWGIAKIYNDSAAQMMIENKLSTSPTVVFQKQDGNSTITLEDGTDLLIEGNPSLLDHVAICDVGVWDKGGNPTGVVSDSVNFGESKMSDENKEVEEVKAKADAEEMKADAICDLNKKFDAMMSVFDSLTKKMDSFESKDEPKEVVADKKVDDNDEIKKRIDAVEEMMPKEVSDAEYEEMADAQAKADSVAMAFGDSASRPLVGESVLGYRKRLAGKFKQHSSAYKDVDIAKIADPALFGIVEKQIYSDAMSSANNPVGGDFSGLREIKSRSPSGHYVSTFRGKMSSWTDEFKSVAFKASAFNTTGKRS